MKPCDDLVPLIAERASGALSAADEARVGAHLETCPGCRDQARRLGELVSLARVAGPSALEEREAASLPRRAVAAARRPRPSPAVRRWALGLAGVAAVAIAIVVPLQRPRHHAPVPEAAPVAVAAADGATALDEADAIAAAAWEITDDAETDAVDYLE